MSAAQWIFASLGAPDVNFQCIFEDIFLRQHLLLQGLWITNQVGTALDENKLFRVFEKSNFDLHIPTKYVLELEYFS